VLWLPLLSLAVKIGYVLPSKLNDAMEVGKSQEKYHESHSSHKTKLEVG